MKEWVRNITSVREGPVWVSPFFWATAYIVAMPLILTRGLVPWGPLDGKIQLAEVLFAGWALSTFWLAADNSEPLLPPRWRSFAFYGFAVILAALAAKRWWPGPVVEVAAAWYGLAVAFLCFQVARTESGLRHLVRTWVGVGTGIALLGLAGMVLAWYGFATPLVREYPNLRWSSWRLTATMPLPNMAYAYFHWSWFLAMALLLAKPPSESRLKGWLAVGLIGMALVGTISRGLVAAGVGLWFLLWQWPSLRKARWIVGICLVALFVYSEIFVTWTYDLQIKVRAGSTQERLSSAELAPSQLNIASAQFLYPPDTPFSTVAIEASYLPSRYLISKRLAWRLFRRNPLLGVGPGNFPRVAMEAWLPNDPPQQRNVVARADPHSTYFGALAEMGLVGFSAVLLIFGGMLYALVRTVRRQELDPLRTQLSWVGIAGLAGYLVFAMNVDVMNFRFLWAVLGILAGVLQPQTTNHGVELVAEAVRYSD